MAGSLRVYLKIATAIEIIRAPMAHAVTIQLRTPAIALCLPLSSDIPFSTVQSRVHPFASNRVSTLSKR